MEGKVTMKLPQCQDFMTLHNVVFLEDAPANLLSQATLLAKGWDVQITKDGGMMCHDNISIPVYKTGQEGTLRAFRLLLKKDCYIQSEQQEDVDSLGKGKSKRTSTLLSRTRTPYKDGTID
jgi:hypothetical protein